MGNHYANPNQYLECSMSKVYKLFLSLDLEMEDADCASILTDIDLAILEISLEKMFISTISAKRVQPDRSSTMFHHLRSRLPLIGEAVWHATDEVRSRISFNFDLTVGVSLGIHLFIIKFLLAF